MKIGLVSDTHGDKEQMKRALNLLKDTHCILHAGDHYRDALWMNRHYAGHIIPVTGNGDPEEAGPHERLLKMEGKSILLCHGHRHYLNRGITSLFYHGVEQQADIIVFGHTHVPFILQKTPVILNPGSVSRGRNGQGNTCAILQIGPTLEFSVTNIDTGETVVRESVKIG